MRNLEAGTRAILLCRARSCLCALPLATVGETMRALPLTAFPGAPPFVMGIARIRGLPTPVVDLGAVLGRPEPAQPSRFVTLRREGRNLALAVESVLGVREIPSEEAVNLPSLLAGADQEAVAAIGSLDAELLLSLEAAGIVPDRLFSLLAEGAG